MIVNFTYCIGCVGLSSAVASSALGQDGTSEGRGNKGDDWNDEGSELHFAGMGVIFFIEWMQLLGVWRILNARCWVWYSYWGLWTGFIYSEISVISYSIYILANLPGKLHPYQTDLVRSSYSETMCVYEAIARSVRSIIRSPMWLFSPLKAERIQSGCSEIVSLKGTRRGERLSRAILSYIEGWFGSWL